MFSEGSQAVSRARRQYPDSRRRGAPGVSRADCQYPAAHSLRPTVAPWVSSHLQRGLGTAMLPVPGAHCTVVSESGAGESSSDVSPSRPLRDEQLS